MKRIYCLLFTYLLVFLFSGCHYVRRLKCAKNYEDEYSSYIKEKTKEENKTFQYSSDYFHPQLRLPDSLLGSEMSGSVDMIIYVNADTAYEDQEILSVVLWKTHGKSKVYHDYRPHCQSKPLKKHYHERLLGYLEVLSKETPIEGLREISPQERQQCFLYPVFMSIRFNPNELPREVFWDSTKVRMERFNQIKDQLYKD